MKVPELDKPVRYVGLYIVDFGDHAGVGFTADEVAELLEGDRFADVKVYKIHRACPDGTLELKGVQPETFHLEGGMFFYAADIETAERNFKELAALAETTAPPCRAKLHMARRDDDTFITALIYPAEYDDEVSRWLIVAQYETSGAAEGGAGAVQRYYDQDPEIIERRQLFGAARQASRTGEELLKSARLAVQR